MSIGDQPVDYPQFKDRSTGLIVFGAFQILMGVGCVMLIPMMFLSLLITPPVGAPTNIRMMIPAMGFYVVSAVLLIWLGVGSIRARRWARALTLVLAWMWLAVGVMSLLILIVCMPNLSNLAAQQPQVPPQVMILTQVVMLGTMGCMYLVVPGAFICFYQSPHVKATCEFKDPRVRWTDRCPLPVLALSLLLGFGAATTLFAVFYGGIIPFCGVVLRGVPGVLVILCIASLFAYLAWATYKLKMGAWWATLVSYLVLGISTIVTFSRVSMMDFYRQMDMPQEQLDMLQRSGMIGGMKMPIMMSVSFAVLVTYMLWARRYFVAGSPVQTGTDRRECAEE